jgi:hypothetical protein
MAVAVHLGAPEVLERGTCFGFTVNSELEFSALRHGVGEPLEILESPDVPPAREDQLVYDWRDGDFHAQVFEVGFDYRYWVKDVGWFEIQPSSRRIVVPPIERSLLREELIWGIPAILCFRHRGEIPVHGAAIEIDGGAVLLAGPARYGKSTLAAAFAEAGYRVLSEDVVCLRPDPLQVIPGPATLRLRRDVGSVLEVGAGVRIVGGSSRVRYALHATGRGECTPVPVRAVYFLARSEGVIEVTPISRSEAIKNLWRLVFQLESSDQRAAFAASVDLAACGSVCVLRRPFELDRLHDVTTAVVRHLE